MNSKESILLKHVSLRSYVIGFVLSIVLTLISFGLVYGHKFYDRSLETHPYIIPVILIFALVQLVVQLIFFLHLLHEDKPRWNLIFFASTFGLIVIVVVGSVWIMNNLNYNMMPTADVGELIRIDEGIQADIQDH